MRVEKVIISLGAGVQSSTMALMAACGELTPMPDCAIFADTQGEPRAVYEWLDWLEKQLPFPVYRVSKGNLAEMSLIVRRSKNGKNYTKFNVPAFMLAPNGSKGITRRQCTGDFKIDPIKRKIRELVGRGGKCEQWIGISSDEIIRMKDNQVKYITNRWPLIEKRMTRQDCLKWMELKGYPKPPRSACVFCPFHSSTEWAALKPDEVKEAVEYEKGLQAAWSKIESLDGVPYLHSSCLPLEQALAVAQTQGDLWPNECEGHCGV